MASRMVLVGNPSIAARRVCRISEECTWIGIELVRPGVHLGDIGHAIQRHAENSGCSVVREYCGHGIGERFHEDPQVLQHGKPGTRERLEPGMTFTIEPMINAGKRHVKLLKDGWTVITKDRSLSAQWEHTVLALTDEAPPPALLERVRALVAYLRDLHLAVGQSVRSPTECAAQAREDVSIATSMMESRLLARSHALYGRMRRSAAATAVWSSADFPNAKLAEQRERYHRVDDTAHTVEPNVQEIPGGPRGLQIVGWIARHHFNLQSLAKSHESCKPAASNLLAIPILVGLHHAPQLAAQRPVSAAGGRRGLDEWPARRRDGLHEDPIAAAAGRRASSNAEAPRRNWARAPIPSRLIGVSPSQCLVCHIADTHPDSTADHRWPLRSDGTNP